MRVFPSLILYAFLAFNLVLVIADDLPWNVPAGYFPPSPHQSHPDKPLFHANGLSIKERHEGLVRLVRRFLSAMKEIKVTVWLAHGTLLGWHWGQKVLPWDTNINAHIHFDDLKFLAAYYNMSFYMDGSSAGYVLDINPNYLERSQIRDPDNIIDARWIDMTTGLFVDITAVCDVQGKSEKGGGYLLAKDGHYYRKEIAFPLKRSEFEMEEAYIPRNASAILLQEYDQQALQRTSFKGYVVFYRPFTGCRIE